MLIQSRITELFRTTNDLVLRQYTTRLETVAENEQSLKEELEGKSENEGFEDDEDV